MIDLDYTDNKGEHLLNLDNHLEVALKKNKEPPKPDHTGKIIAAIVLFSVIAVNLESTETTDFFPSEPKPVRQPHSPSLAAPSYPAHDPFHSGDSPSSIGGPGLGNLQIDSCHGHPSSAHFRAYPAHDAAAIKGIVPIGEWVYLTGEMVNGGGIRWYEAVNYSPLAMSNDGYATSYQPQASQFGWIAACFVE
jgi:hypothetical protein